MSNPIGITLDRTTCRPGERLAGKAGWQLEEAPKKAKIRLFWQTSGKGTTDTGIVEERQIESPQAAQLVDFTFDLPSSPYSFEGRLITLRWGVEVVAGKASSCTWFELGPDGHAIHLGSAEQA
jgi:hypothetical protein